MQVIQLLGAPHHQVLLPKLQQQPIQLWEVNFIQEEVGRFQPKVKIRLLRSSLSYLGARCTQAPQLLDPRVLLGADVLLQDGAQERLIFQHLPFWTQRQAVFVLKALPDNGDHELLQKPQFGHKHWPFASSSVCGSPQYLGMQTPAWSSSSI